MRKLLGAALVVGCLWGLWFGLSQIDVLPEGLRLPVGEYGALLRSRR